MVLHNESIFIIGLKVNNAAYRRIFFPFIDTSTFLVPQFYFFPWGPLLLHSILFWFLSVSTCIGTQSESLVLNSWI